MVRTFAYPARVEADEGGRFLVTFPDLPEALTDGATRAEALAEASDALGTALAGRILDGDDIPKPSPVSRGLVRVAPSATIAAKVALYLAMGKNDVSAAELARRLGIDHKEARRLLSPRELSKMTRLEEALAAVGQRVELSVRDEHAFARAAAKAGHPQWVPAHVIAAGAETRAQRPATGRRATARRARARRRARRTA